jgi:hypothetical protein
VLCPAGDFEIAAAVNLIETDVPLSLQFGEPFADQFRSVGVIGVKLATQEWRRGTRAAVIIGDRP